MPGIDAAAFEIFSDFDTTNNALFPTLETLPLNATFPVLLFLFFNLSVSG